MNESITTLLKLTASNPKILKPQKPILLLSHMRANTSLIGHILGSHPEINGYYEMHIGYYSKKSLYRQKLRFFNEHPKESVKPFLFDKVLHNEHEVTAEFITTQKAKYLYCIREPIASVNSVIKLYHSVDQDHEFYTVEGAASYYIERLKILQQLKSMTNECFFYKAEDLIENTDKLLSSLSRFLGLSTDLTPTFNSQKLSNKKKFGDSSGNLLSGEIIKKKNNQLDVEISDSIKDSLMTTYNETLSVLDS